MKIYKFSNILAIPFFILLVIFGYLTYQNPESSYLAWILLPLIPLMLIYVFSPQIEYWWLKRNPIELDAPVKKMLNQTNPVYSSLDKETKEEFERRLVLFSSARDFIGKGMESDNNAVPHDIKMMISQVPVTMTLGRSKAGFKHWERIVLYKHPFPTPMNKFLHTMETHGEDGVVILSLEHVDKALVQKGHHYDVTWHAYAEAFIKDNPKEKYPELPANIWESIEKVSPQDKSQILGTLGFKTIDAMPVLINLYFNYHKKFAQVLPEIKGNFDQIFFPGGLLQDNKA